MIDLDQVLRRRPAQDRSERAQKERCRGIVAALDENVPGGTDVGLAEAFGGQCQEGL